ncbi:MAG: hypothetical protein WD768_07355 [Phycisphaeraceae bacterium]
MNQDQVNLGARIERFRIPSLFCSAVLTLVLLCGCGGSGDLVSLQKMLVSGSGGTLIHPRMMMLTATLQNGHGVQAYAITLFIHGPAMIGNVTSRQSGVIDQGKQYVSMPVTDFRGHSFTVELFEDDQKLLVNGVAFDLSKGRLLLFKLEDKGAVTLSSQLQTNVPYVADSTVYATAVQNAHGQVRDFVATE